MQPFEDTNPAGTEYEWDSFSIVRTDFHRHWNGDFVNLFTLIKPEGRLSQSAELAAHCTRQIAGWVLANRERFGAQDRFQIVVAWPLSVRNTSRQIVKTGGTYEDLEKIASKRDAVPLRHGWSTGIFFEVD